VDTKLEYRRLVERYAENGEISFVGQRVLNLQREKWGLSHVVASAIENEVLEPVRKYFKNLEQYEITLEEAIIKYQFPLPEKISNALNDLQESLGLRDEDIKSAQEKLKVNSSLPAVDSQNLYELEHTENIDNIHLDNPENLTNNDDVINDFNLLTDVQYQENSNTLAEVDKFSSNIAIVRFVLIFLLIFPAIYLVIGIATQIYVFFSWTGSQITCGDSSLEQKSIDACDILIQSNPSESKFFLSRGKTFYKIKKVEKAIADYGEAIRLNPDYAEAYKNRAEARFSLKDPKGAIEDYSRAIKLKFEEAETYNRIGIIQASLDNHPEAIISFTQAIKYSNNDLPERAKSYNYRGKSKAASQNFKGAIEDYTESIELSNTNSYSEASSIRANALVRNEN
jgi:tetratricopeptide (TPR) repeat protein